MVKNVLSSLLLSFLTAAALSQGSVVSHIGFIRGNRVHSVFDDRAVMGQPASMGARGSWIYENNGYIGDASLLLGLELPVRDYNHDGIPDTVHSVITCQVSRPTKRTDTDPLTGKYWTFEPVAGYCNTTQSSPALLTKPETWPTTWPGHPGLDGLWNGLFGSNPTGVAEEAYFRIDDRDDERFNDSTHNKWKVALIPDSTHPTRKGQGVYIDVRYLQSNLPAYRDVLFRVYDITNEGTTDYAKVVFGNLTGNYVGVTSVEDYREYANDAAAYFASRDFILNQNYPENSINNPLWTGPVGKFAETFLESPAGSRIGGVAAFAPSNALDLGDDQWLWNMLRPGQYLHPTSVINDTVILMGEDMDYIFGSNYFSLNAGETKRVVTVLAYGYDKSDIQQKILMAKAFWKSGFNSDSVKSSIRLTNPVSHETFSGSRSVTWTSKNTSGTVSIWYSPNAGESWLPVAAGAANTGQFSWNTTLVPDAAFGLVRIFIADSAGVPYGYAESPSYFTVNNAGMNTPFVHILNGEFQPDTVVENDTLALHYIAGTPAGDSLRLTLYYRTGKNETFISAGSHSIPSDTSAQKVDIVLGLLPNSDWFQIKAAVAHGSNTWSDSTSWFAKRTPRRIIPLENAVFTGPSSVIPRIDIIDRSQLRADKYTVTFVDTAYGAPKTFSVYDSTLSSYTLKDVPLKSAVESPAFDGMALYVEDVKTQMDRSLSGWNQLLDKRNLSMLPVDIDGFPGKGYPNPSDYRIIFYNSVVDTSVEVGGNGWSLPAVPLRFKVTDLTRNRTVRVAFFDVGGSSETLFREEIMGVTKWTWDLHLDYTSDAMPGLGDTITVRTTKGISSKDTLRVSHYVDGINPRVLCPSAYTLFQNYPNPFNPFTIIKYTVGVAGGKGRVAGEAGAGGQGSGVSKTSLVVYDVLGRRVATLVNEVKAPGSYEVHFDASGLASGVYLYRLTVGSFTETKRMVLIR